MRQRRIMRCITAVVLAVSALTFAEDTTNVPPRAARSVHLHYLSPEAAKGDIVGFYSEVTVEKSVPGTYIEVCGFAGGYFGIQQLERKKVGIFSVWDTGTPKQDQKDVDNKDRVETIFLGDAVRASRFSNEGTGGHSDFDCDWAIGHTYRFYLSASIDGHHTNYTAYFSDPDKNSGKWFHVATFAAPDGGKTLHGLYSFIEDFRRDIISATQIRRATYGNGWIRTASGQWLPLTRAKFTASDAAWEAKGTIDAGVSGDRFYLQTGGDTLTNTPLGSTFRRPQPALATPPNVIKFADN